MPRYARSRSSRGYSGGVLTFLKNQSGYVYKGPGPFPPLPLVTRGARSSSTGGFLAIPADASQGWGWLTDTRSTTRMDLAKQRAFHRLMDMVRPDSAELAVAFAERQQAFDMIHRRASQLRRLWKGLRSPLKRRIVRRGVQNPRRPSAQPKQHASSQALSGAWLELWMGWLPLLSDIKGAVDVLQGELPLRRLRASASVRDSRRFFRDDWLYLWQATGTQTFRAVYGGELRVSNPNLFRANSLGLINPATVGWELIPFSFIVDWFIPVGDFLSQWSAFAGLDIVRPYEVNVFKTSTVEFLQNRWSGTTSSGPTTNFQYSLSDEWAPPTRVILDPPSQLAATRALTSIALLVQLFLHSAPKASHAASSRAWVFRP